MVENKAQGNHSSLRRTLQHKTTFCTSTKSGCLESLDIVFWWYCSSLFLQYFLWEVNGCWWLQALMYWYIWWFLLYHFIYMKFKIPLQKTILFAQQFCGTSILLKCRKCLVWKTKTSKNLCCDFLFCFQLVCIFFFKSVHKTFKWDLLLRI